MRLGLTTGACAIAASKAALLSILERKCVENVIVELPIGLKVQVNVNKCRLDDDNAEVCIIKDAGDNAPYDITHGAEICAKVKYIPNFSKLVLIIIGGEGVGINVKDDIPAISETVLEYIDKNISELLDKGIVKIELKVPNGHELWSRTMNKVVGIYGGISILGEKGIELPVTNPYSSPYLSHIDKLIEEYSRTSNRICLTFGGKSSKIARELLSDIPIIEVGDHLGYAIDKCVDAGIEEIYIVGGFAKMIKVSAGLLMMHSAYVDARIEIALGQLVRYLLRRGVGNLREILEIVQDCESILDFLEKISKYIDVRDFAKFIVDTCRIRLVERCLRMKGRNVVFHVYSILPDGSIVGC
ncbi:MAG: cobalt-precorrin-5B (C(1))-methyltransferase [Crenarchaeota archaeon]|nr:cobalt-precorrin-5B (C(1))-methyltransferase [Thermoproteota archaeon]